MATTLDMTCPACWGASKPCTHCNGTRKVADMQLSENFKLSEFLKSKTAIAKGISNVPPPEVVERLKEMAAAMEQVRAAFGPARLTINSGYRCPELNKAIGGSETSAHCKGSATDFVISGLDATGVMKWLLQNFKGPWDQAIDEPGWFHLGIRSPNGKAQRKQTLVMRGGKYSEFKG